MRKPGQCPQWGEYPGHSCADFSTCAHSRRSRLRWELSAQIVGMLVMPALTAFLHRYPGIELDVDFSDRLVDVI